MRIRSISILVLITCVLAGCARREADEGSLEDASSSPTAVAPAQQAEAHTRAPAPASLSSVQLQLTLGPGAEQALAEAGETVLVEVIFAGDPAPGAAAALNELGLVEIGKITHELEGSGTLSIDKEDLDESRLAQIQGQPHIIVNTTSSRTNSDQNLLACPFYWETLSVASADGIQIACDARN